MGEFRWVLKSLFGEIYMKYFYLFVSVVTFIGSYAAAWNHHVPSFIALLVCAIVFQRLSVNRDGKL
jgi:hypothetical protein